MIDEVSFRKEREELKHKIIARQIDRLPMMKQWRSILFAASLWSVIMGGLSIVAIRLLTSLNIPWAKNIQDWLAFSICFGVMSILMILPYLILPSARALRRGLAYAELGRVCLQLEQYETAISNNERAAQNLSPQARHDSNVGLALGSVYTRLGLAHCALGHYQESRMYYSQAQQTFPHQREKDLAFLEMALVEARIPAMQVQAKQNLLTVLESITHGKSRQAVRCLVALAALAVARSDLDSFISYRTEAITHCKGQPPDEIFIQLISLLGLQCSNVGDVQGAIEITTCARRLSERMNIIGRPVELPWVYKMTGTGDVLMIYESDRNEQVIARSSAMLSESIVRWKCEDYEYAIDLAQEATRDIRERRDAAVINYKLQKWETAVLACLGRMIASRGESGSMWTRYYALGRCPFVFLDDLATDDLDFHDYVGFGLHNLLGVEGALAQEKSLLDEAQQQNDSLKQITHLVRISTIYQAAQDWGLARQYQAQAVETARSQSAILSCLAFILRQLALTLQEDETIREYDDLYRLLSEAQSLLSRTDDAYYRACGLSKLGAICFGWGKVSDAIRYYQEAVQVARSARLLPLETDLHLQLSAVYKEKSEWENALITHGEIRSLTQRYPFIPIQALRSDSEHALCLWHLHRSEDALQECRSYLEVNARINKESTRRLFSVEFRPLERDIVNNVMVQLLYEDFGDDIDAFERVEYTKMAKDFSFDKLKVFLRQQTTPIIVAEYYTTRDYTLLFVVDNTRRDLSVYQVSVSHQQILNCMDLLKEEVHHYHQWQFVLDSTWQELAQSLIEPLFTHLDGQNILYIIPHGPLYHLPLHAIRSEGRYLIDRCPVVYAPSAAVMMKSHNYPSQTWERAVVIGNPNQDLTEATREVREVARLFNAVPRIGQDAKFNLHRELIDTDVLHIASHGLFDPERPTLSGILLADELLTIPKINEMSIRASLVTLSGCETGLSKVASGNQLVGMMNAFLQIGIPSLLVSLWKADDGATSELMVNFYTQLKSGSPSLAHALRSAQLNIQQSSPWSHPYYWAPFILIGHWY